MATLHAELIEHTDQLERLAPEWDRLAVQTGAPYAAPGWCLAWWRSARPSDALLRTIAVREGGRLVALAPLYCVPRRLRPTRFRFLGADVAARIHPLAEPEFQDAAAAEMVRLLAQCRPRPDIIEFAGVPEATHWPELLTSRWPAGEALAVTTQVTPAPSAKLNDDDYEAWLAGKSSSFRKQARYNRRRLDKRGATIRLVTDPAEAVARLDDFERLHEARWKYRGGSGVLDERVMAMLRSAATELVAAGRFRLRLIEHDGTVISAQIIVAAGGFASYWLGGFDEEWSSEQPSMQCLLSEIEHLIEVGERRFDLGPGDQPYKKRLADGEELVEWVRLYPPGARRLLARVDGMPSRVVTAARQRAFAIVPRERKDQLKRALRRVKR